MNQSHILQWARQTQQSDWKQPEFGSDLRASTSAYVVMLLQCVAASAAVWTMAHSGTIFSLARCIARGELLPAAQHHDHLGSHAHADPVFLHVPKPCILQHVRRTGAGSTKLQFGAVHCVRLSMYYPAGPSWHLHPMESKALHHMRAHARTATASPA